MICNVLICNVTTHSNEQMHSLHVSKVVVTVLIIGSALSLLTGTLQAEFVEGMVIQPPGIQWVWLTNISNI